MSYITLYIKVIIQKLYFQLYVQLPSMLSFAQFFASFFFTLLAYLHSFGIIPISYYLYTNSIAEIWTHSNITKTGTKL